jgi:hypothetical protein
VRRVLQRMRRQLGDEAGIGMILVIGIMVFVAGITATAGIVAMNGLGQSRQRIAFEQALAAAEAGIDRTLGQVQWAYDSAFADYPIPAPGIAPVAGCTASTVQLPPESTSAGWDEKGWADAKLDALELAPLAGDRPACMVSTPTGDVLILKPINAEGRRDIKYGRVYARGWSPGWGNDKAVERTIKVEYVFMPYQPKHAVLTGANLELQGSYLVDEANGVDPATAGVHTNGNLTVTGSGGDVSGPVTYNGTGPTLTFSGGVVTKTTTPVRIPPVSAERMYFQAESRGDAFIDVARWRDLCTDGKAHVWSASGPCMGDVSPVGTGGWVMSGTSDIDRVWTATRDVVDGTYYVEHANARNGSGNPSLNSITVIASATTLASKNNCPTPRYGGSIDWDHYAVGVPNFGDLWFLADQDLRVHANFDAGTNGATPVAGTYIAGEEIELWTSSSMLVGSVLAANQCPDDSGIITGDANEVQGQNIWFKPNADSPFSSMISTTLWLEY